MGAVQNGAELVKRLKATKTPPQRLAPARAELLRIKNERNEVANSAQVIAALERVYGPDHMTVVKARAIARDGVWVPPVKEKPVVEVEEEFLADADVPVSAAPVEPEPEPVSGKKPRTRRVTEKRNIQAVEPVTA